MTTNDEPLGIIFLDGQRCEATLRSESQEDGTWHNAILFRRDGRMSGKELFITGTDWHLPPEEALNRARALNRAEQDELFRRAIRPRSPLL